MMSLVPTTSANLDENNDDNLRGSQQTKTTNRMFCIGRELCFLLLIVFTTYASFNSSNTGAGPPPAPFFSRGSLVGDFYKGELSSALLRASEGDVSFIMYYAPWDAESQVTRRQFETVALQHYKQVYFAGVNCWQPRGDCKRTLSKIQQFPKLVAYVTHESGVEYRGPRTAQYMGAFLQSVVRPLHRLLRPSDLTRLRSAYNAVVVAYLNFHGMRGGPPYRAIYETALKHLERDVRQEVAFAVVTSFKTTLEMGGNRTPCIRLYLWNETIDFPGHFTAGSLSEWVSSRMHQVSLWVSPPGVKSLTLAPYVTQGPALLMFTPFDNFVMYDLLREVGLEYYNCNNNSDVTQLANNISAYVSERISRTRRALLSCQSHASDLAATVQIVNNVWTNSSCGGRRQCLSAAAQCGLKPALQRNTLTSMLNPEEDPLGAAALSQWAWRERCRDLGPPPSRLPPTPLTFGLQGLACRTNHSLSLLALDSSLFAHFARGLGVDPEHAKEQTKVVLVNSQMETTHVLGESVTRASLSQLLVNFTGGRLERFQRSQPSPPPAPSTSMSVMELTADTFLTVAFNDSTNVVVLYYTPHCAFCQALGHVYLTVARLLQTVPGLVFTRLDGENNDVPWQFTAPHYPSILFFPARRKAESRVFPSKVGITVDSLSQFVLANLNMELRLLAMLQLCQRYPDVQWRRQCVGNVRRELLDAIASMLSRYRSLSLRQPPTKLQRAELRKLLTRLQHLKQLQLSLSGDSARAIQLSQHFLSRSVLGDDMTRKTEETQTRLRDEL